MTAYRTPSAPLAGSARATAATSRPDRVALALSLLGAVATRPGSTAAAASRLADGVRDALTRDPLLATTSVVAVAAGLFYRAEHGQNPKVQTYADALLYCSTSISVGYHDIFPKTETGKLVAVFLHAVGPALAARTLDPPARRAQLQTR